MYVAKKTWFFWHAAVRRMPSDREHAFFQGGKSTSYEYVCLVTANSGVAIRCGKKAAVAGVAHQALGAACQLALQAGEQLGTGFRILARLFLIATDDVAAALELDLLDRQIGFTLLPRNGQRHRRTVVVQHA